MQNACKYAWFACSPHFLHFTAKMGGDMAGKNEKKKFFKAMFEKKGMTFIKKYL